MVFKKIKKFFERMYIRHMFKKAEKIFGDTSLIDYRPEKKEEEDDKKS